MKHIKVLELSETDRLKLEKGYHNSPTHNYRIRCKSILLKSSGKSASEIAEIFDITLPTVYAWIKRYKENGIKGLETRSGYIIDYSDEESVRKTEENRLSVSKAREVWVWASDKKSRDITSKRFLGALVQDISKYENTKRVNPYRNSINTRKRSYKNLKALIPKGISNFNIFGIATIRNQYKGFTTQESINAGKLVDYLDVLDNASVHRNRKIKEIRMVWEDRGLFLFYLPPYSPELNSAEILWRILKSKLIRPADYNTKDSLFYCTNMALPSVCTNLFVNYSYV